MNNSDKKSLQKCLKLKIFSTYQRGSRPVIWWIFITSILLFFCFNLLIFFFEGEGVTNYSGMSLRANEWVQTGGLLGVSTKSILWKKSFRNPYVMSEKVCFMASSYRRTLPCVGTQVPPVATEDHHVYRRKLRYFEIMRIL